jgi:hypothetical protein
MGGCFPWRVKATCWLALVAAVGVSASACDVTPEKIQQWKGVESGPRKLREAVRSDRLKPEIRVAAAEALVELARPDDLAAEVKEMKPASQAALLQVLAPKLIETARGSDPAAQPSRKQRNAKDALFVLRDSAGGPQKNAIDAALIDWVTQDFSGRQTAGAHAGTKILKTIGPKAGPALVGLLKRPGPDLDAAAKLLGEIGDETARNQGGEALIVLARKQKPIQEWTFVALGRVGGPAALKFLGDMVETDKERGLDAIKSLALAPRPETLPLALSAAKNRKLDHAVRDLGLEIAAKIGGRAAAEGVAPLIDDPTYEIAWHAFEVVLQALKADGIPVAFGRLQLKHLSKKDDVPDFLVKHVRDFGGPAAREKVLAELESKNPAARLAAVLCLDIIGTAADAPAVEKLTSDATKIKGWPAGATIGSEARVAVEHMKQKR